MSGYYSFIEDFRRDVKSVREVRRARFCNGWIKTADGNWEPVARARFTASNAEWESKENIDAGVDGGFFYLVTGGDTKMHVPLRSMLDLTNTVAAADRGPNALPAEVRDQ